MTSDLFSQIGGSETFDRLVRRFYDEVQNDPVLWPMYPHHDLEGSIHRLSAFLQQYWGGPTTYSDERGHPRLRQRHVAFTVNPEARDRWLAHMRTALDSIELPPLHDETFWGYLDRAAHSLVNTFEE
ncbi:MAG: globin [Microbacteriaceae bacterium]|nr:globin [Microbacteriaceae bacterium]